MRRFLWSNNQHSMTSPYWIFVYKWHVAVVANVYLLGCILSVSVSVSPISLFLSLCLSVYLRPHIPHLSLRALACLLAGQLFHRWTTLPSVPGYSLYSPTYLKAFSQDGYLLLINIYKFTLTFFPVKPVLK